MNRQDKLEGIPSKGKLQGWLCWTPEENLSWIKIKSGISNDGLRPERTAASGTIWFLILGLPQPRHLTFGWDFTEEQNYNTLESIHSSNRTLINDTDIRTKRTSPYTLLTGVLNWFWADTLNITVRIHSRKLGHKGRVLILGRGQKARS